MKQGSVWAHDKDASELFTHPTDMKQGSVWAHDKDVSELCTYYEH